MGSLPTRISRCKPPSLYVKKIVKPSVEVMVTQEFRVCAGLQCFGKYRRVEPRRYRKPTRQGILTEVPDVSNNQSNYASSVGEREQGIYLNPTEESDDRRQR
jgi:hypothetical protein